MNDRILKTAGLITGVIIIVLLAAPTHLSLLYGGILVIIGEAVRIWASGHLTRDKEVTTSGPYAFVRDPLYLGRLFILTGLCVMAWGYALLVLPVGLLIFFLNYMPRKHRKEMDRLESLFGEEYRRYADYAHSLVPRIRPYPNARQRSWQFSIFWNENREQYLLAAVLITALLIIYRGL